MTLSDFRIYRFRLKLTEPLVLKDATISSREGLAVQLSHGSCAIGWGEVSPLPGFSAETLQLATRQLTKLKRSVIDTEVPGELEKLDGRFERWLGSSELSPSVRFGFESAVLNLISNATETPLPELLGAKAPATIAVNGLLTGTPQEIIERAQRLRKNGFTAMKLKVGARAIEEEIALLALVRESIGDDISLRLDANRRWSYEEAVSFMQAAEGYAAEYIEEPARNLDQLRKLVFNTTPPIPVALDESLAQLKPGDLSSPYRIGAVVIKPTMLGLERAMLFARAARDNEIVPVISAAFESSLGIYTLASLAAVVNDGRTAAGLDTISRLAEDICESTIEINNGFINLADAAATPGSVKVEMLEEIE